MPRLINANEILKSEHQHYDYVSDEYYVLVRDIENAPTVDAEPVRHGYWKVVKSSIHPYGNDVVCSVCGFKMGSSFGYGLCPHCGAKMDEVEDE